MSITLETFRDLYKDRECVILTCGPSLTEYPKEVVRRFLKDKIVICVKEAILEYNDEADFFFFNTCRDRPFDNINPKTIKVYQCAGPSMGLTPQNKPDMIVNEDRPFSRKNQLLNTHNFDAYNFKNNEKRPWGPGILYETVFYFCLYAGFKNVYTIGWDMIDTQKSHIITHYFDNSKEEKYRKSKRWGYMNYRNEMILVNNNIPYFYDYLKYNGMNISVIGNQSYVNPHIPRIYL